MWLWAAAEDAVQSGSDSGPVIVALISTLGGVIAAAFAAIVSLARRDSTSTTPSPPTPDAAPHAERIGRLERRAEDSDGRDDMQDRRLNRSELRLEDIERHLDRTNPRWR